MIKKGGEKMDRGQKLQFFMKERGYNKSTLSKASEVPYTTIDSMIKNNLKNSSIDNVIKICKVLGIQVEDLLENGVSKINESKSEYVIKPQRRYPFFPVAVSAGLPIGIEPITDAQTITIPDEILGKYSGSKKVYFLRVNGESMNKVIPHGSLIAVKQVESHELKDGDIVVYSCGGDYAVKRLYKNLEAHTYIFRPESTEPTFTDYVVHCGSDEEKDLRIHGKVVAYVVNLD